MVKIKFDVIQKVMEETGASFEEADKAVRKSKGDFGNAVYLIEKKRKKAEQSKFPDIVQNIMDMFRYKFEMRKGDKVYVSVNTLILALIFLVYSFFISFYRVGAAFVPVFIILISMYAKVKISLIPPHVEEEKIELQKVSEYTDEAYFELDDDVKTEKVNDEEYNKIEVE